MQTEVLGYTLKAQLLRWAEGVVKFLSMREASTQKNARMARSGKVWPGEIAVVIGLNGCRVDKAQVRLKNEFSLGLFRGQNSS